MNVFDKIKRSWWIVLSFIPYINGFGFVYIGLKQNNKYWVFEGVIYEIPWLFNIIFLKNPLMGGKFFYIGLVAMLVSIIRSIWVAIKLADVYDYEDDSTVKVNVVNNQKNGREKDKISETMGCCICIFLIFVLFAFIAIL